MCATEGLRLEVVLPKRPLKAFWLPEKSEERCTMDLSPAALTRTDGRGSETGAEKSARRAQRETGERP